IRSGSPHRKGRETSTPPSWRSRTRWCTGSSHGRMRTTQHSIETTPWRRAFPALMPRLHSLRGAESWPASSQPGSVTRSAANTPAGQQGELPAVVVRGCAVDVEGDLVHVTPPPVLARFVRPDDRVRGRVEVGRRVAVGDVATRYLPSSDDQPCFSSA